MAYNKITVGYVVQTYNDDTQCMSQEFIASDDVTYETLQGEKIEVAGPVIDQYCPMVMVQPELLKSLEDFDLS